MYIFKGSNQSYTLIDFNRSKLYVIMMMMKKMIVIIIMQMKMMMTLMIIIITYDYTHYEYNIGAFYYNNILIKY